jgi:hypothetical protein
MKALKRLVQIPFIRQTSWLHADCIRGTQILKFKVCSFISGLKLLNKSDVIYSQTQGLTFLSRNLCQIR